jgi:hypothetical protein
LEALGQEGAEQGDALLQSSGDLLLKYKLPVPEMFSELEQAQISQAASRQQQQQGANHQQAAVAQSPSQGAAVKQEYGAAQATDQQQHHHERPAEQAAKRQRVGEPATVG